MAKSKIILILFFFSIINGFAQKAKYLDLSLDFETRAWDLVHQMNLKEKISQLGHNAPPIPRLGIEKYNWWNEALHGVARAGTATVFPQAIGMAASFDTEMMFRVADIISDEARAKYHEALRSNDIGKKYYGLTFWSPNINIFRDSRWGRGQETYGEDPYLTGQMGIQFVKGLQGNDPKYLKLVATAKHFAVHSGPESERHFFNAIPDTRDLWETYLPAFENLVEDAEVSSVMSAYNRVYGESASASNLLLEKILRETWGFKGYVVSDCGAIRDIYKFHKITDNKTKAAALGIDNGCDLCCGGEYQSALKKAIAKKMLDENEIDTTLFRLMYARMKLGMFDPDKNIPFAQIPFKVNNSPEHDAAALKMAQKSMVLLKNNGILPLKKESIKKMVVIGPNANSIKSLRGNYYGEASDPVTVLEGIKKLVGNAVEVYYTDEVQITKNNSKNFTLSSSTISKIKESDLVLFVGGLDATLEGEEGSVNRDIEGFSGGDRTRIELPDCQLDAIRQISQIGKPLVFVLMTGSSIAFKGLEEKMDALVLAWYPGQRGGDAVADVLLGNYNPAGRLPVTFYKSTGELGDFRDYNLRTGKGLTYRFYEGEALFPFGFGLSYTQFEYSGLKIDKSAGSVSDEFIVSVNIKNTGNVDGEEVIQIYIRDLQSPLWMPKKELKGFQRIFLKAGEQKTVLFKISAAKDCRHFDINLQQYVVEPGDFELQIGSSSQDIKLRKSVTLN